MAIGLPSIGIGLNRGGDLAAAVRALFAASEQGFWRDPSDPATAFQTSTGTTAGVVGQPLGLRLDKRRALATTPIAAASLFNTATWTKGVGWSAPSASAIVCDGSQAASTDCSSNPAVTMPAVAGSMVRWRFTVTAISGVLQVFPTTGSNLPNIVAPGSYTGYGPGGNFAIFRMTAAGATCSITIDGMEYVAGNHALQATSPSRPVWAQDGAFYRDTFDGFDDSLSIAAGGGSTTGFFYCGAVNVAGGAGTARTIISDAGANTGYRLRINAANVLELAAGNGVSFTTAVTAGTLTVGNTYVVTAWHDGVNLDVQIGQGTVGQTAFGAVTAGTAGMTEGKDNGAASSFLNGSVYNLVYRAGPTPSAAQIAAVQRYIAGKAGVAL
jgi:hypothetical protein